VDGPFLRIGEVSVLSILIQVQVSVGMDPQHQRDLERILENRRRRGVRQPTPQPQPTVTASRDRPPLGRTPSPVRRVQVEPEPQQRVVVAASPRFSRLESTSPIQRSADDPRAAAEEEERRKATAQLLHQQTILQKNQLDQQRQLEVLQNEIRKGLANVTQAIQSTPRSAPVMGYNGVQLNENRRSQFVADSTALQARLGSLQRDGGWSYAQPPAISPLTPGGGRSVRFSQVEASRPNPVDLLPSQMPRSVPIPVVFDERKQGMVANPRAVRFPQDEEQYYRALAQAPREPPPIPVHAQPYSSSTIDIESSVTILRSGDWFLKWSSKGKHVEPRFIWLDTEKNIIQWGKERGAASFFSGYIRIEEIHDATTDQMFETGTDDIPRVYYILILHTKHRKLQLATEKKEKMNLWYDAINNIALFYRVKGSQLHAYEDSTE
jgi:hypothetical protein